MFAHLNPRRLFCCGCIGAAVYISIHYILLSVSGICHWALFIVPAAIGWSLHDVRFLFISLLLTLLWADSGTVRSCDHSSGIFCAAVRFHLYVENPYICRWIYFGLIPALSVNTTVHSVVSVAAGSYDRHRHIYRYFDFTPATGTAWFYINRKKL